MHTYDTITMHCVFASVKEVQWVVKGHEYLTLLDEDATLGAYIMGKVEETGQIFTAEDTFWVDKPVLEVEVCGTV